MTKKDGMNASRRAFVQKASSLGVVGAALPWAINLTAMAEASAQTATDYKAIVCIFLNGGNDQSNTVVPYDTASHSLYQGFRPRFAHNRWDLSPTVLVPTVVPKDRNGMERAYALSPKLTPLVPLFNAGNLGIILNVGPLVEPITKAEFQSRAKQVPPKLFSHNDQASVWQSTFPEGANPGWGGRMGDLFMSKNVNSSVFTCINVASNAVYLSGNSAVQYQMSPGGPVGLDGLSYLYGSNQASAALKQLVTENTHTHYMEKEYGNIGKRSVDATKTLNDALATGRAIREFPKDNSLADQLRMVARLISVAGTLGVKRQVFFVSLSGFDNHDGMAANHPVLMAKVGEAMAAFYAATKDLGVANNVTSFTASDFGRTLSGNDNGSDHGWGSMQFVMGGAVKGKKYYGKPPVIADGGQDDVGRGRLLPTTSVEQLAATLGAWMGMTQSELITILPNLTKFSERNLGFV